jgi:hypothetical protein
MPKNIVYHGTFSDKPPHEYEQERFGTFHAGTIEAAKQRLADKIEHGDWSMHHRGTPEFGSTKGGIGTIHAYEISGKTPATIADEGFEESNTSQVQPYTNHLEDVGSLSFVIPISFVGNSVKYLGPQFQELYGTRGESIARAATTMVGGKQPDTKQ